MLGVVDPLVIRRSPAASLYPNQGLHSNAEFISSLHPRAIEYLQQAPVIALCFGAKANTRADRLYIASRLGGPITRGDKLRAVMDAVPMAYPLRKISATILAPRDQTTMRTLGGIPPSTLSQIIPMKSGPQRRWLGNIAAWRERLRKRHCHTMQSMDWLARQLSLASPERNEVEDVADFFVANRSVDMSRWCWDRAMAETVLWHDRLAAEQGLGSLPGAIQPETQIDYSDWPSHFEHDGFEFFKLQTPSMLMEEGRRMRHCVASYIGDVLNGKTSIFSMRSDMRRIATVQVEGRRAVQIRGFANKMPSAYVSRAVDSFVSSARP